MSVLMETRQSSQSAPGISIRPFRKPDIGFVISRQLSLYEREYGFDSATWYEYLTGGVEDFIDRFDREKDCMYILEHDGVSSGCIAIAHVDEMTAQLRFFFLEPDMRGRNAGRMLLDRAMDFCKEKKYQTMYLWTFSSLMAARHLYAEKGFRITDTHVNNDWGTSVLEERWQMDIVPSDISHDGYKKK